MYKPHTTSAIGQEELQGTQQNEMILVAGLDTRPEVDNGSGTSEDVPGSRTDMLALVSIPEDGSRATVVSIPRDTSVTRSECNQYNIDKNTYNNKHLCNKCLFISNKVFSLKVLEFKNSHLCD